MSFLSNLEWRFATKKFDPTYKIPPESVDQILEAARLAPSSYGLQPTHIKVITPPELRVALRAAAYDQPAITDASHLLVFCSRIDLLERVEAYIKMISQGKGDPPHARMIRDSIQARPLDGLKSWADRQTYLALGFSLAACAELQVDSLPMEGFKSEEFDQILELPPHLKSVVLLAVGRRAADPARAKIRFPRDEMIEFVD